MGIDEYISTPVGNGPLPFGSYGPTIVAPRAFSEFLMILLQYGKIDESILRLQGTKLSFNSPELDRLKHQKDMAKNRMLAFLAEIHVTLDPKLVEEEIFDYLAHLFLHGGTTQILDLKEILKSELHIFTLKTKK